jgi:hypothetical protein
MPDLIRKARQVWQNEGLLTALVEVATYPARWLRHRKYERQHRSFHDVISTLPTAEERFTYIFKNNHWAEPESVSGFGSTLRYTERVRGELPKLLNHLGIKSMLDAPCGDFNWMRYVLREIDIEYIGGDIVRPLIDKLNIDNTSNNIKFLHLDIIRSKLPDVDLMMCRDCLFHLSQSDIISFLRNFASSNIEFLLTTSHENAERFTNRDISTGDFRELDLFAPPYSLPNAVLASIEDWCAPEPRRFMHLWTREQIAKAMTI